MQNLLLTFDNIDGVFAVNSAEARGAEKALLAAARKVKAIVSVGGTFLDAEGLSKESMLAAVVIEKAYSIGEQAVIIGARLSNGEKPLNTDVLIPPLVVTRETIGSG